MELPEVTLLQDARGERPESALGIGAFWYEPEVWSSPLSPAARVLYAALCSYLGHGEINRADLRNALKSCTDAEIAAALGELCSHRLLLQAGQDSGSSAVCYEVRSINEFK